MAKLSALDKLANHLLFRVKQHYRYGLNVRMGRPITDQKLKKYINAILYVLKTGCQWSQLPAIYGPKSTVYDHFKKWTKDKVIEETWTEIYDMYQDKIKYDTNLTLQIVDTTMVKSINGTDCIGKNPTDRGRNATKLSLIIDKNGVPISYLLSDASVHDSKLFEPTIKRILTRTNKRVTILADKGYSSMKNQKMVKKYNMTLICPNKTNFKKKVFFGAKRLGFLETKRMLNFVKDT